ncbi:hypothetical protein Tco_0062117, partial [Tanacetum coccineum]
FVMSSDNASSAVTYTSVSSDLNGPSWGIPLVNADELPEMDPYEEVAQQGQAHLLSPTYVHDPMELDEHVPVYVLEPEHPEYHDPEDEDEDPEEDPSEEHDPEDEDDDPKEDPSEEHDPEDEDEDPEEDPSKEHKPEDEDAKEDEPTEDFDE